MNNKTFFQRIGSWMKAHKGRTTAILVVVALIGYYAYHRANTANAEPQYVLSPARIGTLRQTVTGTGQVSASNQTDIQSQVSGTILSISVNVGQNVTAGQLIATIDPKNAALALQNAQLALAKLTEPPKATDLSNAQNSVSKSYNDAFDAASTAYLDLPGIMAGMKDLLYGQGGFLSDQQSSFLTPTARTYRDASASAYDAAVNQYASSLAEFKNLSRSSADSDIDQMLDDTYTTMKQAADAVSKAQDAITYISTYQPDYDPKGASAAAANVNGWATQANGDVSAIVNAQNTIASSKNSLTALQNGADTLDIQTAQLNVEQAQETYDNYFIRAPYDGVIGRIPVNAYGQAGASTVIATIVGQQKIASISLNEVDAAKVKVGQPVTITFDAIDGLNATGTVNQVDQVGTVTQGVVSYGVKILINTQDDRIKPGMSVNTTIITNQEDNVLLVPNSAVKTQGNVSYVQTFDQNTVTAALNAMRAANGQSATSTRGFGRNFQGTSTPQSGFGQAGLGQSTDQTGSTSGQYGFASSTRQFGSTTRSGFGNGGGGGAGGFNLTIPSTTAPQQVIVTVGDSDDTNTVILSGLSRGQFVVTRTIASGSATTASAPSILSSFGGRGGGGGGGARPGGGGGAVIRAGG